jgi:hypothetical protein
MKLLKIFGLGILAFLALIALLLWFIGPHQPSDRSLENRFYKQRPVLERIVAMMNEDAQMSRIATDFTWRQDSAAWPRPETDWGISRERWDEYRKIFDREGFKDGVSRNAKTGDVSIYVWSWGIVPAGTSLSFLHCGSIANEDRNSEPACVGRRSSGSGMYGTSTSYAYRFKKIAQDWYILEQSN